MRSPRTINVIKSQSLNTQLPNVLCEEITSALGMSRMVTSRKSSCVVQLQAQLSGIFFSFLSWNSTYTSKNNGWKTVIIQTIDIYQTSS